MISRTLWISATTAHFKCSRPKLRNTLPTCLFSFDAPKLRFYRLTLPTELHTNIVNRIWLLQFSEPARENHDRATAPLKIHAIAFQFTWTYSAHSNHLESSNDEPCLCVIIVPAVVLAPNFTDPFTRLLSSMLWKYGYSVIIHQAIQRTGEVRKILYRLCMVTLYFESDCLVSSFSSSNCCNLSWRYLKNYNTNTLITFFRSEINQTDRFYNSPILIDKSI